MITPDHSCLPVPKMGVGTSHLEIATCKEGQVLFLALHGDLDMHTAESLNDVIQKRITDASCTDIVADMSAVSFVDSSGLGILIQMQRLLSARVGRVHLAGCDSTLLRLLSVSRLTRLFCLHTTFAEARASVAALLT